MPTRSELRGDFMCPSCGALGALGDMSILFVWGGLPHVYGLNEPILWWHDRTGAVCRPFVFFTRRFALWPRHVLNFGTPECADLVILQESGIWETACAHCHVSFARVGVSVVGGVISKALLLTKEAVLSAGKVAEEDDYYKYMDGKLEPIAELNGAVFEPEFTKKTLRLYP